MQKVEIEKGVAMPILGFGTYKLTGDICIQAVADAIKIGFLHIDTADKYQNHSDIARAIKESEIQRKDLFLTTKVWWDRLSYNDIRKSIPRFQNELMTDYFDLVLIHWPNRNIALDDSFKALTEFKEEGIIRAIGVSNFTINHLRDAQKIGVKIAVNQVEFHPSLNQKDLLKFCLENEITITAYSPIAQGEDIEITEIQTIAKKYGRSGSQVILAWLRQKGIVAIPRSKSYEHIRDNFESLNLNLDEKDMEILDSLDRGNRIINPPMIAEFDY
jgi:2,5-diketo-D-gluconate reductase B